ncbi:MAG: formate--phosphoribosylaminoimidazolecarboxamide ligase [Candidatus Micrarchaeota archaeon]
MGIVEKSKIEGILSNYKKLSIATVCSHSALQIFQGARQEKVHSIGICTKDRMEFYESFPYARPDEFLIVDSLADVPAGELVAREAVVVPHGSFVEYVGERLDKMAVPVFGNRRSLQFERDRMKMFGWMEKAGLRVPRVMKPEEIDGLAIVKFPGAKGGMGYMIVKSEKDYREKIGKRKALIQEFIVGVRAYPHYFHSAFSEAGFRTSYGRVELMGLDRRVESNADEIARAVAAGGEVPLSFTVMGNASMVMRESLLPPMMEIGRNVCNTSKELFGGMHGPFCVETIVTEDLDIYAFEISARIVAGTNILYHPYAEFTHGEHVSTGRRIARELKEAFKKKKMKEIVY